MRAPLHRRTEKIGACIADPFANGEGVKEKGYVHLPEGVQAAGVSTPNVSLTHDWRGVNRTAKAA
jgi:hypothetical protein